RPLRDRRSQDRGTSTSRVTTASIRPPCRPTTCQPAHHDLTGACSQTTCSRPCDFEHSSPCRWIFERLRISVVCLSSMVRPLPEAKGRGRRPRPEGGGLQ